MQMGAQHQKFSGRSVGGDNSDYMAIAWSTVLENPQVVFRELQQETWNTNSMASRSLGCSSSKKSMN